jgi:hypothetical protein
LLNFRKSGKVVWHKQNPEIVIFFAREVSNNGVCSFV